MRGPEVTDGAAILGPSNVYGSPGAVRAIAHHLHSKAHVVGVLRDELFVNAQPATWKGAASDGFKSALGELPTELGKLFDSYGKAGGVLKAYALELQIHKTRAAQLADEIVHAGHVIKSAQDARVQAQVDYDSAKGIRDFPGSYPESVQQAVKDMAHAHTRLQDAHTSITHWEGARSAAKAAAIKNRASFVAAAETCCTDLGTASEVGIQNKYYHGLGAFVHELDSVVGVIWDGLGDVLDEIGDLLDIGTIFAGLLVIAAGIATILSDGALTPLLEGSIEILDMAVDAKVVADIGAVVTGNQKPGILLEDALSVIGGKVGQRILPRGSYDKIDNALVAAKDHGSDSQKLYAAHLLAIFKGDVNERIKIVAVDMTRELEKDLGELIAGADCSKHSGSVP